MAESKIVVIFQSVSVKNSRVGMRKVRRASSPDYWALAPVRTVHVPDLQLHTLHFTAITTLPLARPVSM